MRASGGARRLSGGLLPRTHAAVWSLSKWGERGSLGAGGSQQRIPGCKSLDTQRSMKHLKPKVVGVRRRNALVEQIHQALSGCWACLAGCRESLLSARCMSLFLVVSFHHLISISLASFALTTQISGCSCPLRCLSVWPVCSPPRSVQFTVTSMGNRMWFSFQSIKE